MPRLPFRPLDVLVQVQTDPLLMPIENNAVYWPPRLSPRIPAAVLRIPKQKFDAPEQLAKSIRYRCESDFFLWAAKTVTKTPLSLLKVSSGANVFEISDIQEDEAEAVQ